MKMILAVVGIMAVLSGCNARVFHKNECEIRGMTRAGGEHEGEVLVYERCERFRYVK